MRLTLTFLLSLWLPLSFAGMSSSVPKPVDYFAQLSSLTELISVDAEGGFGALQNRTLSPELQGGVVILTNFRPDWITYTRALRLGLANQGWDLMTPEPSEDPELSFETEGSFSRIEVNHYERSRVNRAECLRHFGYICRGCGDSAEEKYGELGAGVIHVHHLTPVSQMETAAPVNPITDLIPLCPTCHNVVHREDPPISLEKLRLQTGYSE